MTTKRRNKDCITFHLSYLYLKVQEFYLSWWGMPSLAFRTLSLLELASSSGMSMMSLAEWSLIRKCFDTVVGLEILDGLSTGLVLA